MTLGTRQQRPDLPTERRSQDHGISARTRVGVAVGSGAVAAALVAVFGPGSLAPLVGWDIAAIIWVGWTWASIWPRDAEATACLAVREDPTQPAADLLLLIAAVASLAAVAVVIITANSRGSGRFPDIGLGVVSVVLSWAVVHTRFTLKYARLYYTGTDGGVDFQQAEPPQYSDFAYLAFTIGMTFQVSDTNLQTANFRATALRHALLSYLFGTVIVATTINLVAGLGK